MGDLPARPLTHGLEQARAAHMAQGKRRRGKFLEAMRATGDIHEACAHAGVALGTYHKWRQRWDDFAAQVDALRAGANAISMKDQRVDGTFADRCVRYFGHTFAWFHLMAAEAMHSAVGGDVTMFLWPPEHGKTTLTEDFCNDELAHDPAYRITYATEDIEGAKKILKRVRTRMEPDGSAPAYARRYGPFAPVAGKGRVGKQPWSQLHFDTFKKGSFDERDYSMQALGINGSVINTRCTLLAIDDPQSSKNANVNHTEKLLNIIRGDWLSRPGTTGHTQVNSSRQSPDDICGAMVKAGVVDRLIKLPAFDESRIEAHGTPWLWFEPGTHAEKLERIKRGERAPGPPYTEEEYLKLRRNAGEERWDLTYQQKEGSVANMTFRAEHWGPCKNELRAFAHGVPKNAPAHTRIQRICVALDPAIGSANGILAAGFSYAKMYVLRCRSVPGLTNNDQVLGLVEALCHDYQLPFEGQQVTDVVIESKAYQKALMDDRQLHELQRRFGFVTHPHDTGVNKYDENLGVPQMVYSMLRGEFDFPYGDETARGEMDGLFSELGSWRPHVAGKRLRMDRVMVLWFAWMLWRNVRNSLKPRDLDSDPWRSGGLPYRPTTYGKNQSGLLVPR